MINKSGQNCSVYLKLIYSNLKNKMNSMKKETMNFEAYQQKMQNQNLRKSDQFKTKKITSADGSKKSRTTLSSGNRFKIESHNEASQ